MGWATQKIELLKRGETISFRPRGNSMVPKIRSGQLCTVSPLSAEDPQKGDVVLCKVKGREFLHNVLAIQGKRYKIGNNKGGVNGWISRREIFGKLLKVEGK
jgi:SOS-response transcriptional repressor LexA